MRQAAARGLFYGQFGTTISPWELPDQQSRNELLHLIASSAAERLKPELRFMYTRQSEIDAELLALAEAEGVSTLNDLIPLLYGELRRMAKRQLRYENAAARL